MRVILMVLVLMVGCMGVVSAGTISFNDLDLARNEIQIYFINGSGTILNETILSNQTAHINSPNDYVVVYRPRAMDMLASPEAFNPYIKIILGMVAVGAVALAFLALFLKVMRRGAT